MEQVNMKQSSNKTTTTTSATVLQPSVLEKPRTLSLPLSTASSSSSSSSNATTAEVRTLSMKDYKPAAECLAQAFATDEVARYFIDTPDMEGVSENKKWKLHVDILRFVVAAHLLKGVVTTCGDDFEAVALWMPPGKDTDGLLTLLRSGLWRLYYLLSAEGRTRLFTEFFPLLHHTKASVLGSRDSNSMYLVYIGTKPSARGKGYAKKLIQHGTTMADDWNVPTYLESSNIVNVRYYQKLGFVFLKDITLQRGEKSVGLGIMVREPNAVVVGKETVTKV